MEQMYTRLSTRLSLSGLKIPLQQKMRSAYDGCSSSFPSSLSPVPLRDFGIARIGKRQTGAFRSRSRG